MCEPFSSENPLKHKCNLYDQKHDVNFG